MRKKLKDSGGFTLVEMLCAVAILVLLTLMLNTGMQMAMHSYRAVTAESETQLLLNSLVDAVANELRCAHEVTADEAGGFTYNGGRSLTVSEGRVVVAGGDVVEGQGELLPTGKPGAQGGSYGGAYHGGAYRVPDGGMRIVYNQADRRFTVHLKVVWRDGEISAETPEDGVSIRCLNPPFEPKEAEEGEAGAP